QANDGGTTVADRCQQQLLLRGHIPEEGSRRNPCSRGDFLGRHSVVAALDEQPECGPADVGPDLRALPVAQRLGHRKQPIPPSTWMVCLVMKVASPLSKNATSAPTSSRTSPMRFIGTRPTAFSYSVGAKDFQYLTPSDSANGQTTLTRMLSRPHSRAATFDNPRMASLDAEYPTHFGSL